MTYFFASGNTFRVAPNESVDIRNELPVGNYIIKEEISKNLFLRSFMVIRLDMLPVSLIHTMIGQHPPV